ncbi:MAG: aldo/keto reductase, partial [bacterium]
MEYRALGRTGWDISTISFGAWGIGGDVWGDTDDAESMRSLHRAVDLGVNFIDTADVYGDGHSERLVGQLLRERSERIIVATKAGRRLPAQTPAGYSRANLTSFVERSLTNLGVETIDLLQLHCPPSEVYETSDVFGILDDLVAAGKLRFYGVSVELVDDALRAIEYDGVDIVGDAVEACDSTCETRTVTRDALDAWQAGLLYRQSDATDLVQVLQR